MANVVSISLNKARQIQLGLVKQKRPDCATLLDQDIVKKLFFERLDDLAGEE